MEKDFRKWNHRNGKYVRYYLKKLFGHNSDRLRLTIGSNSTNRNNFTEIETKTNVVLSWRCRTSIDGHHYVSPREKHRQSEIVCKEVSRPSHRRVHRIKFTISLHWTGCWTSAKWFSKKTAALQFVMKFFMEELVIFILFCWSTNLYQMYKQTRSLERWMISVRFAWKCSHRNPYFRWSIA